jgi:hypothetical protein
MSGVTEWDLERLREEYPAWSISEGGEGVVAEGDGVPAVTAPSVAVLRVLLANEAWKPLTGPKTPGG